VGGKNCGPIFISPLGQSGELSDDTGAVGSGSRLQDPRRHCFSSDCRHGRHDHSVTFGVEVIALSAEGSRKPEDSEKHKIPNWTSSQSEAGPWEGAPFILVLISSPRGDQVATNSLGSLSIANNFLVSLGRY
jgi:hypothetical protein